MSDKQQNSGQMATDAAKLRKRAEEQARTLEPISLSAQTPETIEQILHELQVHQIELEMQNEELHTAQAQIEAGRARYFDLYDLAPVGYCTLSEQGMILEANLTATTLLGVTRSAMIKLPFSRFIVKEDEDIYYLHRKKLFETGEPQEYELRLTKPDGTLFWAHLTATVDQAGDGAPLCRVVLSDITERKRAEDALREREDFLSTILATTSDGFWVIESEGVITDVNEAYCSLSGYTREEIIGLHINDIDADETPAQTQERIHRIISNNSELFETAHRRKDGSVFPVEIATTYIDKGGGKFVCFARDLTDRKRAEASLRESEEKHRALVEGLPDTIMRFDREGRHLFVSDNVREVVDMEASQFIGKTHAELGFPEVQCRFWEESIRRVFNSGTPFETEFTVEGKVGPATFNWRLVPERDAQGAVSSVLSISRDITSRRKVEQEYKTLFREMFDGFALHEIVCDEQGNPADYRFLVVNPAFERMTGLRAEAIVDRTVLEVLPRTERHWIKTYGKVALSGEPVFFENYSAVLGKHFEVTAFRPLAGQFACIFQDITERKQAEAEREKLQSQLAQAQKMESVGRLAGGVAHDFNNMLGVILGHTEMALDDVDPATPLHASLQAINYAAERSANLTRQLLTFARKQTVAPKVLDLNGTIESMLTLLRRLIGEDIDLLWKPGHGLGPVKIDPTQVDQILANLCVNARDAIADVGKVTIETGNASFDDDYCARHAGFVPGDYALLAVSDDGIGMDAETLSHLFEPFFTTKELGKGTGLGLATVYGAVKQNNGFINVYSEPGQGTTFTIYLPSHAAKTAETKEPRPQAAERGSETILLVEDELAILEMTTMMLTRLGYTVVAANTPGEAIRLAQEHAGLIDLVMTDVVMPEMNGRDLAKNLLSLYPNLKRLFMSGYTANVIAHQGVLDEGVHFIQKPFSMKDLGGKLRETLEG